MGVQEIRPPPALPGQVVANPQLVALELLQDGREEPGWLEVQVAPARVRKKRLQTIRTG